jgi:hypothetical protein
MENRFSYNHYYIPEFYNKVLKNSHTKPSENRASWNLTKKLDYLKYTLQGFPCPPIVLAPTKTSKEYECIDGFERINIIRDFMLGGLAAYLNPQELETLEKLSIDVYICDSPLKEDSVKLIRTKFQGGSDSSQQLAPDSENTIKIPTNVKKIVATVKTRAPKKQIHEALKTSVWNKYIGADKGTAFCYCCKQTQITQREFDTGHVTAEVNGGQTHIDNLRPICRKCNLSMGIINMEDFRKRYFE